MDKKTETDLQYLKDVSGILRQNFDTVHVFCTRVNPDGSTLQVNWGEGNWFARFGQVVVWADTINDDEEPPDA